MSHAPTKEFNDAEECIYSEVKSSNWWWNEQVHEFNFVIATMIMTASKPTAAAWSYNCPCIRQVTADTSFNLMRRQGGMASISETRKHRLNDQIKAFESCHYPCCPSSHSSAISL